MSRETQTPADLAIRPRDVVFARGSPDAPRLWLGGDPIATAFFNALSASFPQGERFFMNSVRPYRAGADAKLAGQIAAFTVQEAVPSREHLVFNARIGEEGFDFGRRLPRLNQLCATIALEHFTAILAATRRFSPLRRWWIRCVPMVLSTIMFLRFLWFGTREFLRHYGLDNFKSRRALLRYLWIEPGLMRRAALAYLPTTNRISIPGTSTAARLSPMSKRLWRPAMRRLDLVLLSAAMLAAAPAASASGILGLWATEKNNGRVLIERCGAALCGRVVDGDQLRARPDQADVNNPDPAKRTRRVKGILLLDGYSGGPSQWRGGSVYDPQTGDESHDSTLTLVAPGTLKVEGCRLLFCRTETWTRARGN